MEKEKTISMSELRELSKVHLENLRCTELTRALLRREFERFIKAVENTIKLGPV